MPERRLGCCCICGRTLAEVGVLHRVNPTGQPGIWACAEHVSHTDATPIDDEMLSLTKALSDG